MHSHGFDLMDPLFDFSFTSKLSPRGHPLDHVDLVYNIHRFQIIEGCSCLYIWSTYLGPNPTHLLRREDPHKTLSNSKPCVYLSTRLKWSFICHHLFSHIYSSCSCMNYDMAVKQIKLTQRSLNFNENQCAFRDTWGA